MSKVKNYVKGFEDFLNEKESLDNDLIEEIVSVLEKNGLVKASQISDSQRQSLREKIMEIADEVEKGESSDEDYSESSSSSNEDDVESSTK
jgi:hypothetical protein